MPRKLSILLLAIMTVAIVPPAVGTLRSPDRAAATQTPIPQPPPRETAKVHVTFGARHEPLVGAEIRWIGLPFADGAAGMSWGEDSGERADLLAGVPALAATDEHGDVEVILEGQRLLVEARAGTLWGAQLYESDLLRNQPLLQPPDLLVELDFDLSVQVVDGRNAPVKEAGVSLRGGEGSRVYDWRTTPTDGEGRVTIRHAGHDLNVEARESGSRFLVAISGCLVPPVAAVIDPTHAPVEPIVLRMPPTGEVVVVYEEEDGTPIPLWGGAAVEPPADPSIAMPVRAPFPTWSHVAAGTAVVDHAGSGVVTFKYVSLGSAWIGWARRNQVSVPARLGFVGPKQEGERVRVVVHPPDVMHLQGRFVDSQDRPCRDVDVSVRLLACAPVEGWKYANVPDDWIQETQLGAGSRDEVPALVRADAQGRFRLDLDRAAWEGGAFSLAFIEGKGQAEERSAIARLDAGRPSGSFELGPLILVPSALLAAGWIHDADGQPLGSVEVSVLETGGGLVGPRFRTQSLADGTFRLQGACIEKRIDLRLSGLDLVDQTIRDAEVGNTSMSIVLEHAGRIRGRVRLPEGGAPRRASVGYTATEGTFARTGRYGSCTLEENAGFELSNLAPGVYTIRVTTGGRPRLDPITRTGVRVEAGKTTDLGELGWTDQRK